MVARDSGHSAVDAVSLHFLAALPPGSPQRRVATRPGPWERIATAWRNKPERMGYADAGLSEPRAHWDDPAVLPVYGPTFGAAARRAPGHSWSRLRSARITAVGALGPVVEQSSWLIACASGR
jgi:hypothetical protein